MASMKVVRRASLGVRVEEVEDAAARVRDIAAELGGIVESEDISTDPGAAEPGDPELESLIGSEGSITVSVPATELETALDRLADVGTVLHRSVTTENVTTQYADTESRVQSARASVVRVRALMGEATELADVVTLEAELSRRTADLEALESQLAALEGQVARSPVTVYLTTAAGTAVRGRRHRLPRRPRRGRRRVRVLGAGAPHRAGRAAPVRRGRGRRRRAAAGVAASAAPRRRSAGRARGPARGERLTGRPGDGLSAPTPRARARRPG